MHWFGIWALTFGFDSSILSPLIIRNSLFDIQYSHFSLLLNFQHLSFLCVFCLATDTVGLDSNQTNCHNSTNIFVFLAIFIQKKPICKSCTCMNLKLFVILLAAECARIRAASSIMLFIHIQYVYYEKFDHITCWYLADF